uniref:Uncharacterized protein n=1 Tax=Mycena chlorophos TaxID=658473 RepID=A0ABQ0L0X4_MYCCL|nr:predicted protein [Mycena chlorophos]
MHAPLGNAFATITPMLRIFVTASASQTPAGSDEDTGRKMLEGKLDPAGGSCKRDWLFDLPSEALSS